MDALAKKPILIVIGVLVLIIAAVLYNNYADRKEAEQKEQESKSRLLHGAKSDDSEKKAQESKSRLLHGGSND
ncbi:MAG: hypothetical protein AB7V48_16335 [Sedimentibacter sp.]